MVLLLYSCKDDADKFEETAVYDFSSASHYFYNYKNIKIAYVPLSNKYTVNKYIFAANNIHVFFAYVQLFAMNRYDFPFYVECFIVFFAAINIRVFCYIHESLERNSHAKFNWFTVSY